MSVADVARREDANEGEQVALLHRREVEWLCAAMSAPDRAEVGVVIEALLERGIGEVTAPGGRRLASLTVAGLARIGIDLLAPVSGRPVDGGNTAQMRLQSIDLLESRA